jgi:hypothetical protein
MKNILLLSFLLPCFISNTKAQDTKNTDTIYAGAVLPNASFLKTTQNRYVMLIYIHNTCSSIKYLERNVTVNGDNVTVVQKLMNGVYTNTDSVIINQHTLSPLQSYSDINTSSDSFRYDGNRVTGTMTSKQAATKGEVTKVDTVFSRTMFNGLIYAENYQCMKYVKDKPLLIADYVPGHQAKVTRVEYVNDEVLYFAGKPIATRVIKARVNGTDVYYWLDAADQSLLKIEGKFPSFEYRMMRCI